MNPVRAEVTKSAADAVAHTKTVAADTAASPQGEAAFVKLNCSVCEVSFVLDMEEDWATTPEEIELEGRDFLDIKEDAVLCQRCLHTVKVTGAERVYWRLALC